METFIYLAAAVAIGVIAAVVALWVIARGPVERLLVELAARRGVGRDAPADPSPRGPSGPRPRNNHHDR